MSWAFGAILTFKAEFGAFGSQLGPPELLLALWRWPFGFGLLEARKLHSHSTALLETTLRNHYGLLELKTMFTFWKPFSPFGCHLGLLEAILASWKPFGPFGGHFGLLETTLAFWCFFSAVGSILLEPWSQLTFCNHFDFLGDNIGI